MSSRVVVAALLLLVLPAGACAVRGQAGGRVRPDAAATSPPPGKEVVTLMKGDAGPVVFRHELHLALEGVDCEKCHGKPDDGGAYRPCVPCHLARGRQMTLEETYHGFCLKCHEKDEYRATGGPVTCGGCHR